MSLCDEYKRQLAWRSWPTAMDALPSLEGRTVLDLGCGVGDQAAALVERGAGVVGIDINDELLQAATARGLAGAEFHRGDLRDLPDLRRRFDGIWCSFAAAYFVDLPATLASWRRHLRPGGWIALTEIDDLFGHDPLSPASRSLCESYAREALAAGRYDFHMGRKLAGHLRRAGFAVMKSLTLDDLEFSFDGPARPDVLNGWRDRLDRMSLRRGAGGTDDDAFRDEFLACLCRPDHRSRATVCCCIATAS